MPDLAKQVLGGIVSGMIILIYAFAFFSISNELKEISPSDETTQAIEDIEESVSSSIKWYYIVGGITSIIGILALVAFVLDRLDLIDVFRANVI